MTPAAVLSKWGRRNKADFKKDFQLIPGQAFSPSHLLKQQMKKSIHERQQFANMAH